MTSARDEGDGTLREAIEAANRSPGGLIDIRVGSRGEIVVERALPALTGAGTRLRGGGATLREGRDCHREGGERGCDGIVVRAADVVVEGLRIAGFTFDGVAVRGRGARGVRIEAVEAVDNLDDGVGVSEGASRVEISRCLLMGNGFRTKGKGLLVFDDSSATLRDSVVVANRDGVTVSRGSSAKLDRVIVAANYDKGIGVSGAAVEGRMLQVLANGLSGSGGEAVPNGDGLRVGLEGRAEMTTSRIAGNGDTGVVVLDRSSVTLEGCEVSANLGRDRYAAPDAKLTER